MKTGIHPEYMPSKITCACGRVTETYATVKELHVEICSHCHPFYTGRQKLVDTAGRVERYRRKYSTGTAKPSAPAPAVAEVVTEEAVTEVMTEEAEADTPAEAEASAEAEEAPADHE